MQDKAVKGFPMPQNEIREWNGKYGRVTFGIPEKDVIAVWATVEGRITVHDDHLTVTPRGTANVAPFLENGRVGFQTVKSISR